MPVPICWASASAADRRVVGDEPLGEALRDDVRHRLAHQLVAAVAELALGLDVQQDDLPDLVDHYHRVGGGLKQATIAALRLREVLFSRPGGSAQIPHPLLTVRRTTGPALFARG